MENSNTLIQQVDGTPLSILGVAWVEIQVGNTTQTVKAIFADIKCPGILGMDFLLPTQGNLDFRTLTLNINGEHIPCTSKVGRHFNARVVVAQTTTIPPGHEAIVQGCITKRNQDMQGPALIEGVEGGGELGEKGLVLGRVLVRAEEEVIPVRILNPGDQKLVLKEGTTVGMMTPVSLEDNNNTPQDKAMKELPDYLMDLYQNSIRNVHPRFHADIRQCLADYQDVFSKDSNDIGSTDMVQHSINTGDAPPIKERLRRQPVCNQEEITRQVKDLEERGVIEPSDSPWAANVVLVKKKDGSKRLCIDYRGLNAVTIKDAYPIPRIDDTLDALGGAKWFSTLDLSSGYWQVALDNDARDKSAFVVRNGLYRWKVMPFGLTNAPATFERLMEKVMKGLQWEILLIYLDDVIVYGKTVQEEIERLRITFSRLRAANLKLKPSKCHLFQTSVLYLGHIVSAEGVMTDPDKIKAIKEWPTPRCVKEVRSFLGLASYYRRFIQGFADIASPLHELTSKAKQFQWSEPCENAFQELQLRLQNAPILAYPLPEGDFVLDTDASAEAMGAVLSQVQDGEEKVIAYFSKKFSKAERNYCVTRRELLAVVVSLKQYKQYLYGRKVLVRTDHASLQWLLNFKNPEGQTARWLEKIAEYDLVIQHRPGRKHGNADGLSRPRCKQCGREDEGTDSTRKPDSPNGETMNVRRIAAKSTLGFPHIREAQLEDDTVGWLVRAKENGGARPGWETLSHLPAPTKTYWSQWDQLEIHQGVICRRYESDDGKSLRWQIILPGKLREEVLAEIHSGPLGGHLGVKKTLAKVKARFYWPGLTADVRSHLRKCNSCERRKSPPKKRRAPLQQYRVGIPVERVAIDLLGPLPRSGQGNQYVMVVGDYQTKWMEAFALPDAKAATVAKKLVEEFVCRYGVPQELHSDQGTNFESELFAEMCKLLGIKKTRTTAYNPKSDGLVERFNRTLMNIIAILVEEDTCGRDWDELLPYATSAYRSTPQESTGESPNMLMLGREVRLPVELTMPTIPVEGEAGGDFAETLRENFQEAHKRAERATGKSAHKQRDMYNRQTRDSGLKVDQFVWLFDPSKKRGVSPKLQLRWKGPYLIVSQLSDVTFRIQASPRSKPVVVHCDRLKPYRGEELDKWAWHKTPDPMVEEPESDEEDQADHEEDQDGHEEDQADHEEDRMATKKTRMTTGE